MSLASFFFKNEKKLLIQKQNKEYKKQDKTIFYIAYSLILSGIILVISASYSATKVYNVNSFHFALKHFIFAIIAIVLMHITARRKNFENFGTVLWVLCIIGIVLTFIFTASKGANRWISIFGLTIQPSEFIKIALIIQGSKFVGKNWNLFFISYFIPIGLLLIQPDLGSCILITFIATAQIIVKKFNIQYIVIALLIGVCLIFISYNLFSHVRLRIDVFLNPKKDIFNSGYQVYKSYLAMKNGGLFGLGFGKGIIKNFLPDSHTDFIFSVLIEEFGIAGGLVIIYLFFKLGLQILKNQTDNPNLLIIQYSCIAILLGQAWLNIASAISLIPTKGLTLPLVSYGGSALIAQGIIFGILIACSNTQNNLLKRH